MPITTITKDRLKLGGYVISIILKNTTDSQDEYMRDLADRVVSGYQATHSQDKYPPKNKKRVKWGDD